MIKALKKKHDTLKTKFNSKNKIKIPLHSWESTERGLVEQMIYNELNLIEITTVKKYCRIFLLHRIVFITYKTKACHILLRSGA